MSEEPGLQAAREALASAQAKLRHLQRALGRAPADLGGGPRPNDSGRRHSLADGLGHTSAPYGTLAHPVRQAPGSRDWRLLRLTLERLRGLFDAWAPAAEDAEAQGSPEWLRRRRELEARALSAETALREIERRQGSLDEEHGRVLAELERVQEGWRLLREEANPSPAPLPEGTLPALEAKVERLTALWERLSARESESIREYGTIDRIWRWVLAVSLPTLEAKALGADKAMTLPTLRRRLEDLDRRWRRSQEKLRRLLGEEALPQLREQLAQALAREEKLLAELETLQGSKTKEDAQLQEQARQEDSRISSLSEERDWLQSRAEQAHQETRLWESLAQAARHDLDGLLAQLKEDRERIEALNKIIEKAKGGIERAATDRLELSWRLSEATTGRAELAKSLEVAQRERESLKVKLKEMSEQLVKANEKAQDASAVAAAGRAELAQGLEAARRETESLKARAREDLARLEVKLQEMSERLAKAKEEARRETESLKARAREDLARLKVKLQEMSERLAKTKEQAQDATAAASAGGPGEPFLGALEPIPEAGWIRVLESLHAPLEAAFAQMRRLFAAGMPEGHKALLRLAAASLAQSSDMVKAVREFLDEGQAAGSPGRLDPVLEAALAAWEPALRRRGVALVRHIPRELPQVQARPAALRMAFFQVLRNAYEAMPRGGCLTVKAWLEVAEGQVCVSFTDTGPGFSQDAASRLFSPFHSTKGRLGLGLALLRRIARRAGGEAQAANVPQQGASVTVRLLVAGAADAPGLDEGQSR